MTLRFDLHGQTSRSKIKMSENVILRERVIVFGPNKGVDQTSQVWHLSWTQLNDLQICPSRSNFKVKDQNVRKCVTGTSDPIWTK